jgi:hypothetical protein
MLGDYYKKNPKVAAIVDQAVEVVKWFNNHSFCLGKLREEQMVTYRQAWALILPVITRWTSHFCSISRILSVNKAVTLTVTRYREQFLEYVKGTEKKIETAERVMDCVCDKHWWKELSMYVLRLSYLRISITYHVVHQS